MVLGPDHHERMSAIQGDLIEPDKTPALRTPAYSNFDAAVISFALHHVDDPVDFLKLLKARVRPGGTVVVVDWVKEDGLDAPSAVPAGDKKYNPANMQSVPMGKVWPGFSLQDVREDYAAAGLTDVEVRVWPEKIDLPRQGGFGGKSSMYIAKATVPRA